MKRFKITLTLLLAALPMLLTAQPKVKYIFYFIGDGMGMGHVNAAEAYNRDVLGSQTPLLMMTFPYAGQVRTYSANNPITDSAAAGSALSSGEKTNNYMVAVRPDSSRMVSVAYGLFRNGYRVGIGTSVYGDDATPAAFYANAYNRKEYHNISSQIVRSHFSFFGAPVFKGSRDKAGKPNPKWFDLMRQTGFTLTNNADSLATLKTSPYKAILLAEKPQGDQVGYTIDSIPGALTLEQITAAGLNQLYNRLDSVHPGFFLMIEAGNIDWAAHANDGGAVIKEILNFQKSIDIAYQFYLQHPDETLIIVTADHDTGGMALGRKENRKPNLSLADFQRISKDRFSDYCKARYKEGAAFTWPMMRTFMQENLGFFGKVDITAEQEEQLKQDFEKIFHQGRGRDEKTLYNDFNQYAVQVFDLLNIKMGIGWTTSNHTGNFVPVYAVGAGSENFGHNLNNTDIVELIYKITGAKKPLPYTFGEKDGKHKNP